MVSRLLHELMGRQLTRLIRIGNRAVGAGCPCFIIAEVGVNHNGQLKIAKEMIDSAAQAGADAVKFQTFKAERLATAEAPKADYQKKLTHESESQLEMLRKLELSESDHRELARYCRQRKITFLSTPFDELSADFLLRLGVPAFKMPSGEITNLPFLEHVARLGKSMIISTGMATLGEVETAVQAVHRAGNRQIALLQCVSKYPAAPGDANLRAMLTMSAAFSVPVGFSDHTLGIETAIAATALGACIVEKHFTLDKNLPGPDHPASLEPDELAMMVRSIRNVEAALGHGRKEPAPGEADTAAASRKSLVAACDLAAGVLLTKEMVLLKRPGTGLPPVVLPFLLGRKIRERVAAGTLFRLGMLS